MSKYPLAFDSPNELYTVYDSVKATLAHDYNPGDNTIVVEGDVSQFPEQGILTLIDQCTDHKERSVALTYKARRGDTFFGIESAKDSVQYFKPKKYTKVTLQLRAEHHNAIVDAIVAIQDFLGTTRTEDDEPFGKTLFGRLNFLKKSIYTPKAWIDIENYKGMAPLTVKLTSKSVGTSGEVGEVTYKWNLGDGTNLEGQDSYIEKTYYNPGSYTVSLTVENAYGVDTVVFENIIKVGTEAPDEALVQFKPLGNQISLDGKSIRTTVNDIILLEIPTGENQEKPGHSYAGEYLSDNGKPLDPIVAYTWALQDDLPHGNSYSTKAAYTLGGMYDMTLRVDTQFGSYRITNYENAIDIMEMKNLWLWTNANNIVTCNEMGLDNETFKSKNNSSFFIKRDDSHLTHDKEKQEFARNCYFSRTTSSSGDGGDCLIFWASGRKADESPLKEEIKSVTYNGFADTYSSYVQTINRPWNWIALPLGDFVYFIFGNKEFAPPAGLSPVNLNKLILDVNTHSFSTGALNTYSFVNGAQEVQFNAAEFDEDGQPYDGHYSAYRSCCKGVTGFILRNSGVGKNFTLKNFYKTEGTFGFPFENLVKLNDVPGGGRPEGQLAPLSEGIYLFNNSGVALVYKEETNAWETTGGGNPGLFRALQDTKKVGYDSEAQSLLVASDGDQKAYLSFDYSEKSFIRFNEADYSYSSVGPRPIGEQWLTGIY